MSDNFNILFAFLYTFILIFTISNNNIMYSLPIYQLDAPPQEGGKLVAMYESVTACAKHLGFNHNGSVSKRCDGKIKSEPYLVYEHDWVLNRHKLISRR